ncbi:hypothetical protein CEXT_634261 [Caerostris extrusa]|uniref:Uncharacterized protein n=1 Tax=Caerostris extrusa TaxID=172846 RepID=A0AAV4NAU3_CAEEX|nr:hypothetical protein CEXT_634261 [Caerostris extrusa]
MLRSFANYHHEICCFQSIRHSISEDIIRRPCCAFRCSAGISVNRTTTHHIVPSYEGSNQQAHSDIEVLCELTRCWFQAPCSQAIRFFIHIIRGNSADVDGRAPAVPTFSLLSNGHTRGLSAGEPGALSFVFSSSSYYRTTWACFFGVRAFDHTPNIMATQAGTKCIPTFTKAPATAGMTEPLVCSAT